MNPKVLKGEISNLVWDWFPDGVIIAGNNTPNPTLRLQNTWNMRVRAEDQLNKCTSDYKYVLVTVREAPSPPFVQPVTYCESDPLMKMTAYSTVPGLDIMYWQRLEPGASGYNAINIVTANDSVSVSMGLQAVHPNALPSYPLTWGATETEKEILYQAYQTREYPTSDHTNGQKVLVCPSPVSPTRLIVRRSPDAPVGKNFAYCLDARGRYNIWAQSAPNAPILNWYDSNGRAVGSGENIWVPVLDSFGFPIPSDVDTPEVPGVSPATYKPFEYYVESFSGFCPSKPVKVELTVFPNPVLDYTLEDEYGNPATGGCSTYEVTGKLNPALSAYVNYQWKWTPNDSVPAVIGSAGETYPYNVAGTVPETVRVRLTGVSRTNRNSEETDLTIGWCRSEAVQELSISPGVEANFVFSPANEGCDPLQVFFYNTSTNAYRFRWYWDEAVSPPYPGNPLNPGPVEQPQSNPNNPYYGRIDTNPVHTFENKNSDQPKDYRVWLQVDNNVCFDDKEVIITVFPTPNASFVPDKLNV